MVGAVFFAGRKTRLALFLSALAAATTVGCGGSDSLKKQITGLETQITAMRADQDRLEERLAAVELASAVPSRAAPGVASASASGSRPSVEHPRLKVIHLSPDQVGSSPEAVDGPASASPDGTGPRPTIRGSGDRIIKTGDGDRGDESTQNEVPAPAPRSVAQLGKGSRGN